MSTFSQTSKLKTYTLNDCDYCEINVDGHSSKLKTCTSEDWEISGNVSAKIKTDTSEDFDYWEVSGSLSSLSNSAKIEVLFVIVFTSAINVRGISKYFF